jgi:hypothetical protein
VIERALDVNPKEYNNSWNSAAKVNNVDSEMHRDYIHFLDMFPSAPPIHVNSKPANDSLPAPLGVNGLRFSDYSVKLKKDSEFKISKSDDKDMKNSVDGKISISMPMQPVARNRQLDEASSIPLKKGKKAQKRSRSDLPKGTEDGYETEEVTYDRPGAKVMPTKTRAAMNWDTLRRRVKKQILINSLRHEAIPIVLANEEKSPSDDGNDFESTMSDNFEITPKSQYLKNWRKIDMERYPHLYEGKVVDPNTQTIKLNLYVRPLIGQNPEVVKVKAPGSNL